MQTDGMNVLYLIIPFAPLVGAIIGGLLFRWLQIFPALDGIAISLRDVVSAFAGSLVVLIALWGWKRFGKQHVA